MAAKIIDGEAVAAKMKEQITKDAAELSARGTTPKLVAVLVGDNAPSKMYAKMQAKDCGSVGIDYELLELAEDTTQEALQAKINELNNDASVSGMILLVPFPPHIDTRSIQQTISPEKDAEGMGPVNMGRLFYGGGHVAPCTPMASVELLKSACDDLAGKEVVIVGHSEIVGKPIAAILLQSPDKAPTVTVCHIATKDSAFHTKRADIVFVAAGVSQAKYRGYTRARKAGENPSPPNLAPLVTADMLKEGAIVIDVAINRIPKGFDESGAPLKNDKGKTAMKTVGDVDFEAAKEKVGAITPVPGGVGPVTVAMLLKNTIACAQASA